MEATVIGALRYYYSTYAQICQYLNAEYILIIENGKLKFRRLGYAPRGYYSRRKPFNSIARRSCKKRKNHFVERGLAPAENLLIMARQLSVIFNSAFRGTKLRAPSLYIKREQRYTWIFRLLSLRSALLFRYEEE